MNFLEFIFGKPVYRQDDFWGKMQFIDGKKNVHESFLSGTKYFAPIQKEIKVTLNGNITSNLEQQTTWFQEIEANYAKIVKQVTPLIEDEFRNAWEYFTIKDFDREFEVTYISIPICKQSPIIWEIVFNTIHDLNHDITITMEDFEAKDLLIDG